MLVPLVVAMLLACSVRFCLTDALSRAHVFRMCEMLLGVVLGRMLHACSLVFPSRAQIFGLTLLFMSLCFDGGTGAYEDKLLNKHHVGAFDLMFNIQFAKMLLAFIGLVVSGQTHVFMRVSNRFAGCLFAVASWRVTCFLDLFVCYPFFLLGGRGGGDSLLLCCPVRPV